MTAPKITKTVKGYFEVWTLGCGCDVRVNTEGRTTIYRQAGVKARLHADDKARLGKLTCQPCAGCGHLLHTATGRRPAVCRDCRIDAEIAAR